jgi:hypothetical protein
MKTKIFLSMILGSCAHVLADIDNTQVAELQKKIEDISTVTAMGNIGARTAPDRADIEGQGWNLSVDVLYWQTKVQNSFFCTTVDGVVDSPINFKKTRNHIKFDWSWGFKVGAGYNFEHDDFDVRAEYTYFRNTAQGSEGPLSLPSGINSPFISDNYHLLYESFQEYTGDHVTFQYAEQARKSLKNAYNDVYLDLGRAFFVSKCLSIRPALGVEATWFSFKGNTSYTGGSSIEFAFDPVKNVDGTIWGGLGSGALKKSSRLKSVGVGPRLGLDTKYYLCNGFSVYGNGNGALLFTYFQQNSKTTYSLQPNNKKILENNFHSVIPTAKIDMGVRYDANISCDTQRIGVALGYESVYYWDSFGYSTIKGYAGVAMYGVNLKLRWDF